MQRSRLERLRRRLIRAPDRTGSVDPYATMPRASPTSDRVTMSSTREQNWTAARPHRPLPVRPAPRRD
ncbi:MAG: hypothetical protein WAS07_12650, partial [Micropruina sp.]